MSIFLEMLEMREPDISPLLLEILLRELPRCQEKGFGDEETFGFIQHSYKLVMQREITTEQAKYILLHLLEQSGEPEKPLAEDDPDNKAPAPQQRHFSTQFARWLDKLDLDDACFLLAHGDPAKAREIYSQHDYRLVKAMRNTWQQMEMQRGQLLLEAAVYGSGGSFGDSSDENTEFYDLTRGDYSASELNQLIKFH